MEADQVCDRRTVAATTITAGAVVGIGSLVALTAWSLVRSHPAMALLDVGVALAGTAAVPLMQRWPIPGALFATALAVLSPAATPPATYGALIVAQRHRFRTSALVGALGVAAQAVQGLWRPASALSYGWWLLLMALAYAAIVGWGQSMQARHALVGSLRLRAQRAESEQAARIREARLQERARIAREMHDVLAHRLSLVATYAGALEYRPDAPPERLAAAAGVVRTGVAQALDELRDVIGVLRDENGLRDDDPRCEPKPQPVWTDLRRLVDEVRAAGQEVSFDDRVTGAPPNGAVARTAYRVVQEALTNARRHAPGRPTNVAVGRDGGGELEIEVSNPLSQRVPDEGEAGLGLVGLAERVDIAGGRMRVDRDGGEFRLRVWLPWPT